MARSPSPWYWPQRRGWYTILHGNRCHLIDLPLDADPPKKRNGKWIVPQEVNSVFHTLLANAPMPCKSIPISNVLSVAEVFEKYLEWCQKHRSPRTYEWSQKHIQSFCESLSHPDQMPATELRAFHVVEWLDKHVTWGANQKRGAIIAVTRPYNWATKLGYLESSPLRGIEKPKAKKRDSLLKPEDFTNLLSYVNDQEFRDLLEFAYETGCRPQEVRHIESRHVRLERHRIEIPPAEAKGKHRWRLIYLSQKAEAIVKRLMEKNTDGKLFRNTKGKPWNLYSVSSRFASLKPKLGVRFAAYDIRHCFATRKLKDGHDPITVASLLGHQDATMLCKHYEHLSDDGKHLLNAMQNPPN